MTHEVKQEIRRLFDLAPLHNPAHMLGISAVEANMPDVPQAVVFDTAFHQIDAGDVLSVSDSDGSVPEAQNSPLWLSRHFARLRERAGGGLLGVRWSS